MHTPLLIIDVVVSPSHILQVEVYRGATPLPLISGPAHQLNDVDGGVSVDQNSLDVELWINSVLPAELKRCALEYRSLMDYDIQLYEVVCLLHYATILSFFAHVHIDSG